MDDNAPPDFSKIMDNVKALGTLIGQYGELREQVNPLSDLDRVLEQSKTLAEKIDNTCRTIIESTDEHWHNTLLRLKRTYASYEPIPQTHSVPDGVARFVELTAKVLKHDARFALEADELMYEVSLGKTAIALKRLGVLTKADVKAFAVTAAEWTGTLAMDFVPGSGIGTKLLLAAFKNIGGVDLQQKLWASWTEPIKINKLTELHQNSLRKAEVLTAGFLEFYVSRLLLCSGSLQSAMTPNPPGEDS